VEKYEQKKDLHAADNGNIVHCNKQYISQQQ
jgi:hypothetical protein